MKCQLTDAEINHLRRVLAWMRVEYFLDKDMQRGSLTAIKQLMDDGYLSEEEAKNAITKRSDQIKQVPKYVRQAIKMLAKKVHEHDGIKGEIVDATTRTVQLIDQHNPQQ